MIKNYEFYLQHIQQLVKRKFIIKEKVNKILSSVSKIQRKLIWFFYSIGSNAKAKNAKWAKTPLKKIQKEKGLREPCLEPNLFLFGIFQFAQQTKQQIKIPIKVINAFPIQNEQYQRAYSEQLIFLEWQFQEQREGLCPWILELAQNCSNENNE
ncbi:unnamed protein product (macronuclear) [Paramecium tetraurelia]|uniref:Uncharacterized protein n=1 Tax=Paramecium tetraurelia TaxID=5888 RepID=A0CYV4_PARTE|nr:uncharacterized protein GSPATT00011572001 [Paramecium tetraurelia]CAK75971.1 unnamed protein product [Paramecium tetraurelia]|eukprot:XP_001443368.1 hypothetical protein (macronuclear) [Paramecium tetraurelia strain d4-2]